MYIFILVMYIYMYVYIYNIYKISRYIDTYIHRYTYLSKRHTELCLYNIATSKNPSVVNTIYIGYSATFM